MSRISILERIIHNCFDCLKWASKIISPQYPNIFGILKMAVNRPPTSFSKTWSCQRKYSQAFIHSFIRYWERFFGRIIKIRSGVTFFNLNILADFPFTSVNKIFAKRKWFNIACKNSHFSTLLSIKFVYLVETWRVDKIYNLRKVS